MNEPESRKARIQRLKDKVTTTSLEWSGSSTYRIPSQSADRGTRGQDAFYSKECQGHLTALHEYRDEIGPVHVDTERTESAIRQLLNLPH